MEEQEGVQKQYINAAEASKILGLSRITLANLRSRGGGPDFYRFPAGAVRYRIQDLTAWAEQRGPNPAYTGTPKRRKQEVSE